MRFLVVLSSWLLKTIWEQRLHKLFWATCSSIWLPLWGKSLGKNSLCLFPLILPQHCCTGPTNLHTKQGLQPQPPHWPLLNWLICRGFSLTVGPNLEPVLLLQSTFHAKPFSMRTVIPDVLCLCITADLKSLGPLLSRDHVTVDSVTSEAWWLLTALITSLHGWWGLIDFLVPGGLNVWKQGLPSQCHRKKTSLEGTSGNDWSIALFLLHPHQTVYLGCWFCDGNYLPKQSSEGQTVKSWQKSWRISFFFFSFLFSLRGLWGTVHPCVLAASVASSRGWSDELAARADLLALPLAEGGAFWWMSTPARAGCREMLPWHRGKSHSLLKL